jgi:MFS family permease
MGWQLRPLWETLDPSTPSGASGSDQYALPVLVEHGGSWPNGHTYVGMIPSWNVGFALLVNANEPRDEARLGSLEQNVLRLIAGRDAIPPDPSTDLLAQNAIPVAGILLLGQVIAAVWAVRVARRRRNVAEGRMPPSRRRILIGALLALALDIAILWLFVSYAPGAYDASFTVLVSSLPDLGLLIVPAVLLAAVWGPIRTVLLTLTAIRQPRGPVARSAS